MKVAVCFFGHLRTFKRCSVYIKRNLLKYYDCDLFMHTWSEYNHKTKTWHENKEIKGHVSKEEIIKIYGEFKDLVVEEQIIEDLGFITVDKDKIEMSLFGLKSMYHSMKTSFDLCKQYSIRNNITYDYVIMIRPDIVILEKFDLDKYISVLKDDEINKAFMTVGNNILPISCGFKYLKAIDLFYWGRPKVILDVLHSLPNIINNLSHNRVIKTSPEFKLVELIKSLGYTLYEVKYSSWKIIRPLKRKDWIKQIIRIKVRKNYIKIHLLEYILIKIFSIRINLLNFEIDCCVGRSYSE